MYCQMSKTFIPNFKTLVLIIAKSAATQRDCPLPYTTLAAIIETIFSPEHDNYNISKYKEYKQKLEKRLLDAGSSLEMAISTKDRSIFEVEDILPKTTPESYKPHMKWFSSFLQKKMEQRHMDVVFRYIKSLNNQV